MNRLLVNKKISEGLKKSHALRKGKILNKKLFKGVAK